MPRCHWDQLAPNALSDRLASYGPAAAQPARPIRAWKHLPWKQSIRLPSVLRLKVRRIRSLNPLSDGGGKVACRPYLCFSITGGRQ